MLKKFQNSIVVFDLDGTLYHTKIIDEQNTRAAISSISEYLDLSKDKVHALLIDKKIIPNSENYGQMISYISLILNLLMSAQRI